MKIKVGFANFCGRVFLVLCLVVVVARPAFAYDDPPIRVARLNYVEGRVSFQPGGETDWAWATVNRPMTAGDSLWTGNSARAEMHIGSTAIRVGGQTSVSFLNLDDRTVQIQLNSGTINLRVRNLYRGAVFEVDTPNLAFTVLRSGDYRITVDPQGNFTTITLRDGQGQVNGGARRFLWTAAPRFKSPERIIFPMTFTICQAGILLIGGRTPGNFAKNAHGQPVTFPRN